MPESTGNDLRCPACGNWMMRQSIEGSLETKCRNKRCDAQLRVEVRAGKPTVTVLATKK
jgi:phage FluMu protein Com